MKDDFSGRAGVIGDGYSDTDLVYGLTDHSHILMVVVTYKARIDHLR